MERVTRRTFWLIAVTVVAALPVVVVGAALQFGRGPAADARAYARKRAKA